jgi:hypothetical protein
MTKKTCQSGLAANYQLSKLLSNIDLSGAPIVWSFIKSYWNWCLSAALDIQALLLKMKKPLFLELKLYGPIVPLAAFQKSSFFKN